MKWRFISLCMMLIFLLSGCGAVGHKEEHGSLETVTPVESYVCFDIHMLKYLLFIPTDFDILYGQEMEYSEGLDDWAELEFQNAEKKLLEAERIVSESSVKNHPEDIAFIRGAIGALYIDMAKYNEAYDYLIDTYVTLKDMYGEDYYQNTVGLSLSHYYYETGDFESCLKEIQRVKDSNGLDNRVTHASQETLLFIYYTLNDIEARIYVDRGEYRKALDLFMDSFHMCEESVEKNEDDTFTCSLEIDLMMKMGDFYARFLTDEGCIELSEKCYKKAISLLDHYSGVLKDELLSLALVKKGKLFTQFSDRRDEGIDLILQACDMQMEMYKRGKSDPYFVEIECCLGDMLGFIKNDEKEALDAYNAALDAAQEIYGELHPKTAMVYECLGRYYGNRICDEDKAMEYLKKGIDIHRKLLTENNVIVAQMCLQLAGVCKLQGDEDTSAEYLEKAYAIYDKLGIHVLQSKR